MLCLHHLVTEGYQLQNENKWRTLRSQTMGCLNFVNIQTIAVTTGATSFTLGVSLGCSGLFLTPKNQTM